jgi:hypothetical protein
VYSYQRNYNGKTLLVLANFTKQTLIRSYDGLIKQVLLNNYQDDPDSLESLSLAPYQALVLDISIKDS